MRATPSADLRRDRRFSGGYDASSAWETEETGSVTSWRQNRVAQCMQKVDRAFRWPPRSASAVVTSTCAVRAPPSRRQKRISDGGSPSERARTLSRTAVSSELEVLSTTNGDNHLHYPSHVSHSSGSVLRQFLAERLCDEEKRTPGLFSSLGVRPRPESNGQP